MHRFVTHLQTIIVSHNSERGEIDKKSTEELIEKDFILI